MLGCLSCIVQRDREERAIKFVQIISIITSETPTLPSHLPKLYLRSFTYNSTRLAYFAVITLHNLHCFSKFSSSHFVSIWSICTG